MSIVRWGTLGCARVFERRMIPAFSAAPSASLSAVASRQLDKAREMAIRYAIPKAYGSYQELLADTEIDAVFIPLPNDLHAEWILRALDAGKHVLCDKPMTLTYAQARACVARAKEKQLRLMEGFMYRHHPQHRRIAEIVRSGAIGRPTLFRAQFTYQAVRDPANIRWNVTQGGGALLDVGVYGVNAARWRFAAEPLAVFVTGAIDPEFGVDLHCVATLEFGEGRTAVILGGFDQAFASRYEMIGTEGVVTAERAFQVGENGVSLTVRRGDRDTHEVESLPHLDQYALEVESFSAGVLNPQSPLEPGEDGLEQARVVEALRRSLASRRRIELSEVN